MKRFASKISRWAAITALLALLAGCVTGPQVRTDFDPEADFGRYRSYAFYQPIAMETFGYATYLTDRAKAGLRREMDARGYVYDETAPDLRVNFKEAIERRTDVYSLPMGYPFYGYGGHFIGSSFGHGFGHGFGYDYGYGQPQVRRYTEGTFSVDVVEAKRNRLVWTGDAVGSVNQRSPQERAMQLDRSITEIFLRYPYRAGSAQPVPTN